MNQETKNKIIAVVQEAIEANIPHATLDYYVADRDAFCVSGLLAWKAGMTKEEVKDIMNHKQMERYQELLRETYGLEEFDRCNLVASNDNLCRSWKDVIKMVEDFDED